MFGRKFRVRVDSKSNKNKQSNKNGNIKSSTFQIETGDATQAVILTQLLEITQTLNVVKNNQEKNHTEIKRTHIRTEKLSKAFNHYVENNGVTRKVKDEVKEMLK